MLYVTHTDLTHPSFVLPDFVHEISLLDITKIRDFFCLWGSHWRIVRAQGEDLV
jgi:hypothetical protein